MRGLLAPNPETDHPPIDFILRGKNPAARQQPLERLRKLGNDTFSGQQSGGYITPWNANSCDVQSYCRLQNVVAFLEFWIEPPPIAHPLVNASSSASRRETPRKTQRIATKALSPMQIGASASRLHCVFVVPSIIGGGTGLMWKWGSARGGLFKTVRTINKLCFCHWG